MRLQWIRVGPNQVTSILIRRENRHTEREHRVKMETEIRVIQLQAKKYQGLPATSEAGREAWNRLSQSLQKESTTDVLISDF